MGEKNDISKISYNFNHNISMNFLLPSTHQDFFQNTFTTFRVLEKQGRKAKTERRGESKNEGQGLTEKRHNFVRKTI